MTLEALKNAIAKLIVARREAHGNEAEQARINAKLEKLYNLKYTLLEQESQKKWRSNLKNSSNPLTSRWKLRRNAFGRRDIEKRYSSRHNQVVRSGRRQRSYPMISKFYKINFDVIIDDKTISKEEFETSLHETKQQCLDEAHQ